MNKFVSTICLFVLLIGSTTKLSAQRIVSMHNAGTVFGESSHPVQLVHLVELPDEHVASPQLLFVRFGLYALLSVEGKTLEGMPRKIKFSAGSMRIWFTFDQGETSTRSTNRYTSFLTLTMVDGDGKPSLSNVSFYDLKSDRGGVWRFAANRAEDTFGEFVSYTDPDGKIFEREALGVTVLRDEEGAISELHTPEKSLLVNVESDAKFTISDYPAGEMMSVGSSGKKQPKPDAKPNSVAHYKKIKPTLVCFWSVGDDFIQKEENSYYIFDKKKRSWKSYSPDEK